MDGQNLQQLQEKWAPILNHESFSDISDSHKRGVVAQLLENQEKESQETASFLGEAAPTNSGHAPAGANVAGFDPVLISLIRRSMPNLIAYDICGVQPMSGPTGLIFAMRSRQDSQTGTETFFDEVDSAFSGQNSADSLTGGFSDAAAGLGTDGQAGTNPGALNPVGSANSLGYTVGQGMSTAESEALGDGASNHFNQMAFSIEKVTVTAKSRALKAEYSLELAQDLKAIHGLNAEACLLYTSPSPRDQRGSRMPSSA